MRALLSGRAAVCDEDGRAGFDEGVLHGGEDARDFSEEVGEECRREEG